MLGPPCRRRWQCRRQPLSKRARWSPRMLASWIHLRGIAKLSWPPAQAHAQYQTFQDQPRLAAAGFEAQIGVVQTVHASTKLIEGKTLGPLKTHVVGVRIAHQKRRALF